MQLWIIIGMICDCHGWAGDYYVRAQEAHNNWGQPTAAHCSVPINVVRFLHIVGTNPAMALTHHANYNP